MVENELFHLTGKMSKRRFGFNYRGRIYDSEGLVMAFLRKKGYNVESWDVGFGDIDVAKKAVPKWARKNRTITNFLRHSKVVDILAEKEGHLRLVEVKQRGIFTKAPHFGFVFNCPDEPKVVEKAEDLGIGFRLAVVWGNEKTKQYFMRIFPRWELKFSKTGVVALPVSDDSYMRLRQEMRESFLGREQIVRKKIEKKKGSEIIKFKKTPEKLTLEEDETPDEKLTRQSTMQIAKAMFIQKGKCPICDIDLIETQFKIHYIDHDLKNAGFKNFVCLCPSCNKAVHRYYERYGLNSSFMISREDWQYAIKILRKDLKDE